MHFLTLCFEFMLKRAIVKLDRGVGEYFFLIAISHDFVNAPSLVHGTSSYNVGFREVATIIWMSEMKAKADQGSVSETS